MSAKVSNAGDNGYMSNTSVDSPFKQRMESYYEETDPDSSILQKPHTMTALVLLMGFFIYIACRDISSTFFQNLMWGFVAMCCVFIFIGMVLLPNGPFIRPHAIVWRAVLATSIIYLMFLVLLLFQDKNDARKLLGILDPSLGVLPAERSYGDACEWTFGNFYKAMDIFVIAHTLGWYVKALILRDYWLCWIISIMFEVMEYSLQHQLPNFNECFWDHWILDVAICNAIGIYLGIKTCEYLSMKRYNWRGVSSIKSYREKFRRTLQQFTPESWTLFRWKALENTHNYFSVLFLIVMFLLAELNCFYLKTLLWIPPEHSANVWRLVLFSAMGAPAIREVYQYFMNKKCKRLGPQAWVALSIVGTEFLIVLKFSKGEFENPMPTNIVIFWIALITLLLGYPLYRFVYKRNSRIKF